MVPLAVVQVPATVEPVEVVKAVAVYESTGVPPVDVGACHVALIAAGFVVVVTLRGADGAVPYGVPATRGADAAPAPTTLVARTET